MKQTTNSNKLERLVASSHVYCSFQHLPYLVYLKIVEALRFVVAVRTMSLAICETEEPDLRQPIGRKKKKRRLVKLKELRRDVNAKRQKILRRERREEALEKRWKGQTKTSIVQFPCNNTDGIWNRKCWCCGNYESKKFRVHYSFQADAFPSLLVDEELAKKGPKTKIPPIDLCAPCAKRLRLGDLFRTDNSDAVYCRISAGLIGIRKGDFCQCRVCDGHCSSVIGGNPCEFCCCLYCDHHLGYGGVCINADDCWMPLMHQSTPVYRHSTTIALKDVLETRTTWWVEKGDTNEEIDQQLKASVERTHKFLTKKRPPYNTPTQHYSSSDDDIHVSSSSEDEDEHIEIDLTLTAEEEQNELVKKQLRESGWGDMIVA